MNDTHISQHNGAETHRLLNHLVNVGRAVGITGFGGVNLDDLFVSTGDNPVTKEEVKKAMDNSDSIVIDSCVGVRIPGNHFKDRKIMSSGGLVKQILRMSKSNVTIFNALGYIGYDYFELKKYLRCRKMSLSQFMGTLSKPQLIEIYNYVDSHMASRGSK